MRGENHINLAKYGIILFCTDSTYTPPPHPILSPHDVDPPLGGRGHVDLPKRAFPARPRPRTLHPPRPRPRPGKRHGTCDSGGATRPRQHSRSLPRPARHPSRTAASGGTGLGVAYPPLPRPGPLGLPGRRVGGWSDPGTRTTGGDRRTGSLTPVLPGLPLAPVDA